MKRLALIAAAGTAVLFAGSGAILSGASAATSLAETSDEHCGVLADTGVSACFATLDQVEDWAEESTPTASGTSGLVALSAAGSGSTLLAIFYEKNNKTGDSLSMYGAGACDGDSSWEYEYPKFSAVGWNDKISSFQGYSSCQVKLFENANYNQNTAGATYGPYSSTNYVGDTMNDKASSARFY